MVFCGTAPHHCDTPNAIFQENRGYLAMIVFPVFAGVLLTRGKEKGEGVGVVPVAVLVLLLLIYGAGTLYRNHVWTDGISLWSDAVRKSPKGVAGVYH